MKASRSSLTLDRGPLKVSQDARRLLRGNIVGVVAVGIVFGLVVVAVAAPVLAPYDPLSLNLKERLSPPSRLHPLGTDEVGRDILSRILHGGRVSLAMGLGIIVSATLVGIMVGLVAGYYGGVVDGMLMRLADMFMAFPYLLLAMLIAVAIGRGPTSAVIALAAAWWPSYARLVRGLVLSKKQELFVVAARAVGASNLRIAFRHVLPQCWQAVTVKVTVDIGMAMIAASSLSFIGLGSQPPVPDWGLMMATARNYALGAWWYSLSPGVALFLAATGFNLLNDIVQKRLNPELI